MTRASGFLSHEIDARGRHRRRKRAEKGEHGPQGAAALHHETEGCRAAAYFPGREARVRARRVRLADQHAHILQARVFRRARDMLRERETLVAEDAEVADFHPGPPPGDRFRGDGWTVAAAPVGKGRECRFRPTQLGATLPAAA